MKAVYVYRDYKYKIKTFLFNKTLNKIVLLIFSKVNCILNMQMTANEKKYNKELFEGVNICRSRKRFITFKLFANSVCFVSENATTFSCGFACVKSEISNIYLSQDWSFVECFLETTKI